jgi:hypothetical protein
MLLQLLGYVQILGGVWAVWHAAQIHRASDPRPVESGDRLPTATRAGTGYWATVGILLIISGVEMLIRQTL